MKTQFSNKIQLCVFSLIFAFLLSACANGPELVNHSFSFNAPQDSPNYEVLAYKYGNGFVTLTSSDIAIRQFGRSPQTPAVGGLMPLGDRLYVKWRNKSTDQVFDKTVNLKPLLPKDMTNHHIYIVVGEDELFVYLKDGNHYKKPTDPIVGPFKVQLFLTRQIFP